MHTLHPKRVCQPCKAANRPKKHEAPADRVIFERSNLARQPDCINAMKWIRRIDPHPLKLKDGQKLTTLADARAYMLKLPKDVANEAYSKPQPASF